MQASSIKLNNQLSRQTKPSSHKEFFQRLYGNLEKSNKLAERLISNQSKDEGK